MKKEKQIQNINKKNPLIDDFRKNKDEVLREVYHANYEKVKHFIMQNKGREDQAKDTYQEAFIALWENIRSGQFIPHSNSSVNAYLFTIAKNKWMDYLRSSDYKKTSKLELHVVTLSNQANNYVQDEEQTEKQRRSSQLMASFKQLGKECRDLLSKVYFEKKSMKEIGRELKLDAASARNKKYRCMQKLRELAFNNISNDDK